ncbi:MAG: hypothetical protein II126_04085 [Erysipelotrichaceae bacterium]|nr:hypothetical protein [Erysipelotrichaceae bacterium]
MKKIITIVMALFVILSLSGCKPGDNPSINVDTKSLDEFYQVVRSGEGRWVAMIQSNNYYLNFVKQDGRYKVEMINHDFDTNLDTQKNYDAVDATYNKDTGIYSVRLIEEGLKTVNYVLHVDVRTIAKNELYAECVFINNENAYYNFESFSQSSANEDFFKLMKEDKGKWAMGAQTKDFYIIFRNEGGKHIVKIIGFDSGPLYYIELVYGVSKVEYDQATKTYTVSLTNGVGGYVLHVDVSRIDESIIKAENQLDNNGVIEYMFVEFDGYRWFMAENLQDFQVYDRYLPTLRLLPDGYFGFTENVFNGFAHIDGTYVEDSEKIVLTVTDGEELKGHTQSEVKQIVFIKQADGKLRLDTDLCMCLKGTLFRRVME